MEPDRSELPLNRAFVAVLLTIIIISLNPLKFFLYTTTATSLYALLVVIKFEGQISMSTMEQKAAELLATLKNHNVSVDTKIAHLTSVKSDIKQKNVPEGAVPSIFESLRLSIASQHFSVLAAGFSTLGHFLKRLFIQEQHDLVSHQARPIYPLLLERLGDHKERVRTQAAQAFTDLWPAANADVEHYVLDLALKGKNPRARETSMIWLSNMTKSHGLLFRTYVPALVACLEDADSAVRDTAKTTVVELFQNAPSRAKSDLKKQLAEKNVRKSITNAILSSLGLASPDQELPASRPASRVSRPASRAENSHRRPVSRAENLHQRPASAMSPRTKHHVDVSKEVTQPERPLPSKAEWGQGDAAEGNATGESSSGVYTGVSPEHIEIVPLDVEIAKEIDDIVNHVLEEFDGRETEENWQRREKCMITLRRLTHGNAPHDFSHEYLAAIKTLLDCIVISVNSLRTTLSKNTCFLVQDFARTCGPKADPMVDILMQSLLKLSATMKKIAAEPAWITVRVLLENVSYSKVILQHVSAACQGKNAQVRVQAAKWLRIVIDKQARHKTSAEHRGGLDIVASCLKSGLEDAHQDVRETSRSSFWAFYSFAPEKANEILSHLDLKMRSNLEKDPANPNKGKAETASKKSPAKSTAALKAAIAAQRKAHKPKEDMLSSKPDKDSATVRPNTVSPPATATTAATAPLHDTSALPETAAHPDKSRSLGRRPYIPSLSSAPMRPAIRPRRPATADPYASRGPTAPDPDTKIEDSPKPHSTDSVYMNPTKSLPKKLDIKKTRSREPQTAHHVSEQMPLADVFNPVDAPEPSAAVQLESPTAPVAQKPVVAIHEDPYPSASPDSQRDDATIVPHDHPHNFAEASREQERPYNSATVIHHSPSFTPNPLRSYRLSMENQATHNNENARAATNKFSDIPFEPENTYAEMSEAPDVPFETANTHAMMAEVPHAPFEPENARAEVTRVPNTPFEPPVVPKSNVLEELDTNEPTNRDNMPPQRDNNKQHSNPNEHIPPADDPKRRRWRKQEATELRKSISPKFKDPDVARDFLRRSIKAIKEDQMDILAYRKLQGVVELHDQMFTDEGLFDDLLLELFHSLSRETHEKKFFCRDEDVKTQSLYTVRFMFRHNKQYFSAYYPRAVSVCVMGVKHLKPHSPIHSGFLDTVEDIIAICTDDQKVDIVDAVIEVISTEERNKKGYMSINFGIYVVNHVLSAFLDAGTRPPSSLLQRVGDFLGEILADPRPDTRRLVSELCKTLRSSVTERGFRDLLGFVPTQSRGLLTYYSTK